MTDPLQRPTPAQAAEELAQALRLLRTLSACPELLASGDVAVAQVLQQAGRLLKAARSQERRLTRQRDSDLLNQTAIRTKLAGEAPLAQPVDPEGEPATLSQPRPCYVCDKPFTRLHFFYDSLCPECAEVNYRKRQDSADLSGRIALVTGARIKIGYQAALKLLRAGARVLAVTRFVHDALRRYAAEPDFADWRDRLTLHALDLRHLAAVERFTEHLKETLPHLDVLVNNAAQTVRRPPAYYEPLLAEAQRGFAGLPDGASRLLGYSPLEETSLAAGLTLPADPRSLWPALLTQVPLAPGDELCDPRRFPPGARDAHGQPIDLRADNSWSSRGEDISPVELLEVQAVNSIAPFLLVTRLEPLLRRSPFPLRWVVNVSAIEGKFHETGKSGRHPHTNMAKAALNMLTRTLAEDYAGNGICINSVDTGWISNEAPLPTARRMEERGFRLPLDVIDAAARVCDPVFTGVWTGQALYGNYLKDYQQGSW